MPNLVDLPLAVFSATIWPAFGLFIEWPKRVKRVQSGDPSARVALDRSWIFQQWALTLAIFALIDFGSGYTSDRLWNEPTAAPASA